MDDTQSNRPDNLGDISDSGLIRSKAKLVPAAIRHETVPAYIRDHAVQRPKMVTTPNLAAVPPTSVGDRTVSFGWKNYQHHDRRKVMIPDAHEFSPALTRVFQ